MISYRKSRRKAAESKPSRQKSGHFDCDESRCHNRLVTQVLSFCIAGIILSFSTQGFGQAWQALHNMSAANYNARFKEWTGQGYRPVQISGYSGRFAAIFEKSNNAPAWAAPHRIKAADYQKEFNKWVGQGYRPVCVTGYTEGNQLFYTAIFEKRSSIWEARNGLSATDYQKEIDTWTKKGYMATDVSTYTVGGEDQYAVIFEKNSKNVGWMARHGLSTADYQKEFTKLDSNGYYPVLVTANSGGRYAAIWQKGSVNYVARHGISGSSEYQDEFDRQINQGYRPVWVNGATMNGRDTYSAIWRQENAFKTADMTKIDSAINGFMATYNVPGLSFAITKGERLVLAKGYGFADRERRERVAPRHRFRIASVSKPITSAAVMTLIEQGKLKLSDKVFGKNAVLGITYGTQPYKKGVEQITIEHLLTHTAGGWAQDLGEAPMFRNPTMNHAELISATLNNIPLQKSPGEEYHYSNFGYCVLGRVIEQVSGEPYASYVQDTILKACGISGMEIGGDTLAQRKTDEVRYYGQNSENPYSMKVSRMDAHGGWISTPVDMCRFLVRVDQFKAKPDILNADSLAGMYAPCSVNAGYAKGWQVNRRPNYWHNGSLAGEQALAVRTAGGLTWSVFVNTRTRGSFGGDLDTLMWTVTNSITSYPSHDLF